MGREKMSDGSEFEGQYIEDKKEGKGKLILPNGDVYEGQFKNDSINGYGEIYNKNGEIYKGMWKNNCRNGEGEQWKANGTYFKGIFEKNMKDGLGLMRWPDGRELHGEWRNNEQVKTMKIQGVKRRNSQTSLLGKEKILMTETFIQNLDTIAENSVSLEIPVDSYDDSLEY